MGFAAVGGRGWKAVRFALAGACTGALVVLGLALFGGRAPFAPRFHLGEITVNPRAPIERGVPYRLTLWESGLHVPGRGERLRDDLDGALVEFADRYPNVTVEVTVVPEQELMDRLARAIEAGSPPDVVGMPEPVWGRPLQVPVDPYLPPEPRGAAEGEVLYYAAAREPWTVGGQLWGFPRWIGWQAWAGHDGRLRAHQVDVDGAVRYGWTWDDVLSLARRLDAAGARDKLALDGRDPVLFMQLVANAGAPWWESAEGSLWSPEVLARAAGFLHDLQAARALPDPAREPALNRIVHFVRNEGLIVGPVNPHLFAALQERLGPELVLLPVPHHPAHPEVATLTPSGYAVFRQEPYGGDGRLRAAMELAYFLSRRLGLAVAQQGGFLPASPRDLHLWRDRAGLHYLTRHFLLDYITHFARAEGRPPLGAYLPPPGARRALAESLPALWGPPRPTPEAWARDTHRILMPFSSGTGAR